MEVPFVDLASQYKALKTEIYGAISRVCDTTSFILGSDVQLFEKEFADYLGAKYCIGVANGTDSLNIAFRALDIAPGDEVIIPAHTFVATAVGVIEAGGKPILVDIDPDTYLIDPDKVEAAITSRTKAICPVHLYGRVCDLERLSKIATKYGLHIVEDSAQSHGAKLGNRCSGTLGTLGSFSFYPGKNLGAYGDGGCLVTDSEVLASKIRAIRNYGSERKYEHTLYGINSRLDSMQAAILRVKLPHLNSWNSKRWLAAQLYNQELSSLSGSSLMLPDLRTPEENVFHLYVIQVEERDRILQRMKQKGVQASIHYPRPFYLEEGFKALGYGRGDFPITEHISARILSLPMFPELSRDQIQYVTASLRQALIE